MLLEFFGNSLGIVWQSLGSWLCQFSMFKISWSFIFSKSTIVYIFKDSWLLSQVLIFKISWLSIFWKSTVHLHIQNWPLFKFLKSADCLHFQSLLSITFSSLLIIYTFKSADCLHFHSQLIVYIFNISWLLKFSKSADYLHFQSLLLLHFQSLLIIYIFRVRW